jgi:ribosome recycling factor
MPINQVANITLIDARTIGVQPYGKRTWWPRSRRRFVNPTSASIRPTHGEIIRIPMPMLTEERRRDLIKVVKHEGENAKIAIRNMRRDANTHLKDALKKHATEDDERRTQDDVQKLTDKYIAEDG